MRKKLSWQAFSNDERNAAIEAVKTTISNGEGCIMNFTMFSDLALSLSIEIEERQIPALHRALSSIVTLDPLEADGMNLNSTKEWLIFLNVSFPRGKGALKQEIPDVPG